MGLDNPLHLAFLLVILLLVFGAKRLPEMGRSLGAGLRGFKQSINGESAGVDELPAASAVVAERQEGEAAEKPQLRPAA
jgi:sec-independent protein translocase protein TatA